jgi:hypothetical protein
VSNLGIGLKARAAKETKNNKKNCTLQIDL